jgi:hypothetical protein
MQFSGFLRGTALLFTMKAKKAVSLHTLRLLLSFLLKGGKVQL